MEGPHPPSHVAFSSCGHVKNEKSYIYTFSTLLTTKLSRLGNWGFNHLSFWHPVHGVNEKLYNRLFTISIATKLVMVLIQSGLIPSTITDPLQASNVYNIAKRKKVFIKIDTIFYKPNKVFSGKITKFVTIILTFICYRCLFLVSNFLYS